MTIPEPDELRAQALRMREHALRKAAATNQENARLRTEIRALRYKNFTLQRYLDNPSTQSGYLHRYEQLSEAVRMAVDMLTPVANGLPAEPPVTLEPARPPAWARVKFQKD